MDFYSTQSSPFTHNQNSQPISVSRDSKGHTPQRTPGGVGGGGGGGIKTKVGHALVYR